MPFWTRLDMNDEHLLDKFRQVDCEEIDTYDTMHDWLTDRQFNSFKIIHINIRRYHTNFDHLLILLAGIKVNLDFIVLSEAWL